VGSFLFEPSVNKDKSSNVYPPYELNCVSLQTWLPKFFVTENFANYKRHVTIKSLQGYNATTGICE